MGRVNQTQAYDQKYVKRYGKLYGSIDFETARERCPSSDWRRYLAPSLPKCAEYCLKETARSEI